MHLMVVILFSNLYYALTYYTLITLKHYKYYLHSIVLLLHLLLHYLW